MTQPNNPSANAARVAAMVKEFRELERRRTTKAPNADPARRDQLLDELQDAVGLAGKMVMENDILKRADKLASGG